MSQVYVLYCEVPHGTWGMALAAQCPDAYRKEVAIDLQALTRQDTALPQLNPNDVAQAFGMGFGVVVLFFLVGRGVGEVLRLIRHG
ncbi:hypothetical protein [Comamonas terrigena]|uniref:hypothetical protein n=1 Tax=Comamonas terrigena TaxID=32013 RepID=UPI002356CCD4|nr:hypothetical protein [Comamonas terrigena]